MENFIFCAVINIVSLCWNAIPSLIDYVDFNGDFQFCSLRQEISFLGKSGPKNQNYHFRLKVGTWTNSIV